MAGNTLDYIPLSFSLFGHCKDILASRNLSLKIHHFLSRWQSWQIDEGGNFSDFTISGRSALKYLANPRKYFAKSEEILCKTRGNISQNPRKYFAKPEEIFCKTNHISEGMWQERQRSGQQMAVDPRRDRRFFCQTYISVVESRQSYEIKKLLTPTPGPSGIF